MKLFLLLLSFIIAGGACAKEDNVHFSGALVAEPCRLPDDDKNITLDFKTITEKNLYYYQRSKSEPFSIHLEDCDPSVMQTVSVPFFGDADNELTNLLILDPSSTASGVAVGIQLSDGTELPINKPSPYVNLTAGGNILTFNAYVQIKPSALANQSLVVGAFKAVSTFVINYQ